MKIFHTADWHLGKVLQGVSLIEEQRFVFNQFTNAVKEEKPDVVIIAGDLYDRSVPPAEAVSLLDEVLWKVTVDYNTPVLAIAGNHDSPARLQFGSRLMQANGLHIIGKPSESGGGTTVQIEDEFGPVRFHLIPFADPSVIRNLAQEDRIDSHHRAMESIIHQYGELDLSIRHVAIAHAFVTPLGEPEENTSDSERPLSIGGAEYVAADLFKHFHYTALGHLHQAHFTGTERIRYSGSPMKYSISEEHHHKGFLVIDLDKHGEIKVEKRALFQERDIRTVKASMADLLQEEPSADYVFVKLLDEAPVLFPMEKVRSVYPNAMHVERVVNRSLPEQATSRVTDIERLDDRALFESFYEEITGASPDEETRTIVDEVLHELLTRKGESL
ncbi:exonuclease SbcCD subunit D [Sporosarcina gallistercoris]|uniref:Nuclease SbcCD subunit D n=1 Tax=Sporosarcina gallistercoris TaxID=2762245 RepID=A0ABR8PI83_9BACL|nr:exonuclease SbcCD subunit D [Sporosarcina gallistercoris]MBD7907871.1 exonuclease SbcCD subunit D [Sporosarcina gallistercoris]